MADISKGKRKYYRATYYDAAGKRRYKSTKCTGSRAAQAAADSIERKAQGAGLAAENATTIEKALEKLLDHMDEQVLVGKRSSETRVFHRDHSGHWNRLFMVEGKANGVDLPSRLCELQAKHVDAYISQRRKEGAHENTIAKELVTMRVTLKVAKRAGDWGGEIDAILPVRFAPEYKPRERWLTREELVKLQAKLTRDHAARVAYAIATSANLGETDRAKRADRSDTMVRVWGTKRTSRLRDVPIILPWQLELLDYAKTSAEGTGGKLFAFDRGFESALTKACEDAEITRCSSNDLRRTFCHWMRQSAIPRELCAAMMGHGSTAMVDKVYGKLSGSELAGLLNRALGKSSGTTVAQTGANPMDSLDGLASPENKKLNDFGTEGRTRTDTPVRALDFESKPLDLPSPREYDRKRSYGKPSGTTVAQRSAPSGVVVVFPKTKRGA